MPYSLPTTVLAVASVLVAGCGPSLNPTAVGLRNCVEQEKTAESRLTCMQDVPAEASEPKRCAEGRRFGSEVRYQPLDDDRRDDLLGEAKYLRDDAWEAVAGAPFTYGVDWGGVPMAGEGDSASTWIKGALKGKDAKLALSTSPMTIPLIDVSVQRDGQLIEDFVDAAPASTLREAADGLGQVTARLDALRDEVHALFAGLYMGLGKVNATTSCYREYASAELRMQKAIDAFRATLEASRLRLEERYATASEEEANRLREDREAWSKADVKACETPKKATDCDGVDAYLAEFPEGERAEEAKGILASVATTIGPLRDEAGWVQARVEACRTPKTSDACDGVKAYVDAFPEGNHVQEAQTLLRLKRGALAQLAAVEEQRRRIAAVRAQQACIQACATTLRACQKTCREGEATSLVTCQRSCLATFKGSCVPACKK